VLHTVDGDLFASLANGAWALFERVPGEHQEHGRLDQVREAGIRLAEFHLAMRRYHAPEVECEFNVKMGLLWNDADRMVDEVHERYGDALAPELDQLRRWYEDVLQEWPEDRMKALTVGWIHNDWHGRNVLFQGNRMSCLFDFDPLHRDFVAADLGYGAFMFSRVARGSHEVSREALQIFLDGYLQTTPLANEDIAAIPLLAWLPEVPLLPYCLLVERDGQDPIGYMQSIVASARVKQEQVQPVLQELVARL
jgi:Ser/Thr protein kinase RdoA (MazF antagonist)